MDFAKIEQVRNGYVVYDSYGDIMGVATDAAMLASLIGMDLPTPEIKHVPDVIVPHGHGVTRMMNSMLGDIRSGQKINAIKTLRDIIKTEGGNRIGLLEAKLMVEAIGHAIAPA